MMKYDHKYDLQVPFMCVWFLSSHVRELHRVHRAANQAGPAEVHAVQDPGKEFS